MAPSHCEVRGGTARDSFTLPPAPLLLSPRIMPPAPSSTAVGTAHTGAIFDRAAIASLLAGGCAGLISDGLTYPISTAKSRLQVGAYQGAGITAPPSTRQLLVSIARTEGWTRLFAGFGTVAVAAPARALYFLGYELSTRQGEAILGRAHPLTAMLAGPIAQLSGSILWVPMDVVKGERITYAHARTPPHHPLPSIR
jgi:hypothetical protein